MRTTKKIVSAVLAAVSYTHLRTIRIPVHMVETINKVKKVQSQLLHQNGHEPSADEIEMGIRDRTSSDKRG